MGDSFSLHITKVSWSNHIKNSTNSLTDEDRHPEWSSWMFDDWKNDRCWPHSQRICRRGSQSEKQIRDRRMRIQRTYRIYHFEMYRIPTDTIRQGENNVHLTFITFKLRCMDVETTLCITWDPSLALMKMSNLVIQLAKQCHVNTPDAESISGGYWILQWKRTHIQ